MCVEENHWNLMRLNQWKSYLGLNLAIWKDHRWKFLKWTMILKGEFGDTYQPSSRWKANWYEQLGLKSIDRIGLETMFDCSWKISMPEQWFAKRYVSESDRVPDFSLWVMQKNIYWFISCNLLKTNIFQCFRWKCWNITKRGWCFRMLR
jgi:hypothetical protein